VNGLVYLDHNATTPVAGEALAEMMDTLQHVWANPSSTHGLGQAARRTLADARARVAAFLGCSGAELVFTSGATEANHMAVLGALQAAAGTARRRLVLSAVEHPGLLALAQRLRALGTPVDLIGVDAQGRLDLGEAARLIGPDVALVCVMGANNETGVLMPVDEVAALAHGHGCLLHVDATQLAGKHPLDFAASGADLMAVSAHKLGGPKGVGALVLRKGLALPALISGRQERLRRGGTENLPGIVGFAAACDRAGSTLAQDLDRLTTLRRRLETGLLQALPGTQLYGQQAPRLANTACLRFGELPAEAVLSRLERAGVVAASGAACTASGTQPSHVLLAMGATPAQARAGVRFSLGRDSTAEDIERALAAAVRVVQTLRAQAPAAVDPPPERHQEPA
jgi:cysteine desulfurase